MAACADSPKATYNRYPLPVGDEDTTQTGGDAGQSSSGDTFQGAGDDASHSGGDDSTSGGDSASAGDAAAGGDESWAGDTTGGDTWVWSGDCYECHGTAGVPNNAPPRDLAGNTDRSAQGVGAHQSHLRDSNWHAPILCDYCHRVPDSPFTPGHRDDTRPADVIFSGLALADNATPDYPRDGGCSNVYCHGSTLKAGGRSNAPVWTAATGIYNMCGACHDVGIDPRALSGKHDNHILQGGLGCDECHPPQAMDGGFVEPARHIDGVVDFTNTNITYDAGRCTGTCHAHDHTNRVWRPLP